ncbi:MAG: prolyl aminopeptidase [Gammaproteobacteria bacterium]
MKRTQALLGLFPGIRPYNIHELKVDEIHTLYIEESGDIDGLPIVFLHGGPGFGTDPDHRRFFDPEEYRIILFDQRGCGNSKPHGELKANTTQDLIEDLEKIREHLNIEKWILFGGSWGSTLALVYAETYPERVMALVLRGIFLCRPEDLAWFYASGGASRIFPDAWEQFITNVPEPERSNIIAYYYKKLLGDDELARMGAAKAWAEWEGCCSTLQPNQHVLQRFMNPHVALSLARIEAHYFMNQAFLEPNQILHHAAQLKGIPGTIIHGRYDVICPLDNAYSLHKAWADSELLIVRDAGHSACELGIINALVTTTNNLAHKFR